MVQMEQTVNIFLLLINVHPSKNVKQNTSPQNLKSNIIVCLGRPGIPGPQGPQGPQGAKGLLMHLVLYKIRDIA